MSGVSKLKNICYKITANYKERENNSFKIEAGVLGESVSLNVDVDGIKILTMRFKDFILKRGII